MANQENDFQVNVNRDLTPDDIVNDFLIGEYELEKLKNGFQAPPVFGEPCAEHRHLQNPDFAE